MKVVFAFSGQGSQYFQMGRGLYDSQLQFRKHLDRLDECTSDIAGRSLVSTLYSAERKRSERFDDLLDSSLAIFSVERAATLMLHDRGIRPDVVVSVSLGILASLVLAGCLTDEEAVSYIIAQSAILDEYSQPGAMISVLGSLDIIEERTELIELAEVSGYMFDRCFVLSMPAISIPTVESILRSEKLVYQVLPVGRAYHSRWIDPARSRFLELYENIPSKLPTLAIWPSDEASTLQNVNARSIWSIVRKPVRFRQTIDRLDASGPFHFVDVGPSSSLSTALRYLLPDGGGDRVSPLLSPFGNDEERWRSLEKKLYATP